ncbi:MAG: SusC/RagA family TonB-linked outer membrane protein [Prevotellaceae bacterium]|nr:SusC/RagA family TonB-linked outer membrane protein [Prevotellaceae bacterium]
MRRFILLFACFLISMTMVVAQTRTIQGTVVSGEDGEPLVGASVSVKGKNLGTATNQEGKFVLANIPTTEKSLIVTYLGYEKQEVAIANDLQVVLKPAQSALEEVVVVGYGSAKVGSSIVGNVTTVGTREIKDKPSPNLIDALQGRVAGLLAFQSSGEPSSSSSFRLHGIGSLGAGDTPLLVVDGAPIDGGSLMAINPNDIESVSILKDAASTSIYGARAANGVIFVTTKTGNYNQEGRVNVRGMYGVSSMANRDYFNNFMNADELSNFWVETGYRTQDQVDALRKQYPYDTRWVDVYYKDSTPVYQGDISFSGGSDKIKYYVAGGLYNAEGIAFRSNYSRYSARTNLEARTSDWLKFGINTSLAYSFRNTNAYTFVASNYLNGGLMYLRPPFYSPTDPETGERYDYIPGLNGYHPEYLAEKMPMANNDLQLNGTFYADITPFKGLTVHSQSNIDAYDQRTTGMRLPSYAGQLRDGSVAENFYRNYLLTFTNTAEYRFTPVEDHDVTLLAGHEFIKADNTTFTGSSTGQTDDRLMLIGAGPNNKSASSGHSEYAYMSLFGRLDYGFNKTYYLNFNIRNDNSSRFGQDNRSAMFYSFGAMWDAKKEGFLADNDLFSKLQVRTSWGTSGNSDLSDLSRGDYKSLATISTTQYNGQAAWQLDQAGNSALTWEEQGIYTASVKTEILKHFEVDVEYYNRVTSNMLMTIPYPYTTGYDEILGNVGKLQNRGVDLKLDYFTKIGKDFSLEAYVNLNYNQGKVLELFQGRDQWTVPNTMVSYVVGKPVCFYLPLFAGIDPVDGKQVWYKPNPDDNSIVTRDPENTTKTFDEASLEQNSGKFRSPPLNGGFGLFAEYKGFSLEGNFSFSADKWMVSNDGYFEGNPANFAGMNQHKDVLDYWKQPGDVALFPKYGEVRQFDSHLLLNASFCRLKTLTFGYQLAPNLLKKQNAFKAAKIYVVGRNLLTFTGYQGPDPEVDSNLTYGSYPNTKEFAVGFDLTF